MSNLLLRRCYPMLILMYFLGLLPFRKFLKDEQCEVNTTRKIWVPIIYMLCSNTFYLYESCGEIQSAVYRMLSANCNYNCYIFNIKIILYILQSVFQLFAFLINIGQITKYLDSWYHFQKQYENVVRVSLRLDKNRVTVLTIVVILSAPPFIAFSFTRKIGNPWYTWIFYTITMSSISIGVSYWMLLMLSLKQASESVRHFHYGVMISSFATSPKNIKYIYQLWFLLFNLINSTQKAMLDFAFVYVLVFPFLELFSLIDILLNISTIRISWEYETVVHIVVQVAEFTFWVLIIAFKNVEYPCLLLSEVNEALNQMIVQISLNGKSHFMRQQMGEFLANLTNRKIELNFYGFTVQRRTFAFRVLFRMIPYFIIIVQLKSGHFKHKRRISYDLIGNYTDELLHHTEDFFY